MQRSPDTPVNRATIDSADSLDRIEELMKKLSISTEKLLSSSERLENLTKVLCFLTIFLAGLTMILVFDFFPWWVKLFLVGIIYIILTIFYYKR